MAAQDVYLFTVGHVNKGRSHVVLGHLCNWCGGYELVIDIEFESVAFLQEGFVLKRPRNEVSVVDHHHELKVAFLEAESFLADLITVFSNLE